MTQPPLHEEARGGFMDAPFRAVRRHTLGFQPVIALRRTIERGVRHPLLGPLCLILLALLLAFTVVHGAHDHIHEGELVVCIAFLISAVASLVPRSAPTASGH